MEENIPSTPSFDENSSKIETIKNLIFGENIQAYNSEFESIKSDILAKKEALEQLIEETHNELNRLIDDVSTDINIRITNTESKLSERIDELDENKVDKKNLGNLLIKMGHQVMDE